MSIDISIQEFTSIAAPLSRWLNNDPALGIELEYEHCRLSYWPADISKWSISGDGSLRTGGVELISLPLPLQDVEAALVEAEHAVDCISAVATERCGLHTHLNMRPYSMGQVWSFAALYALVEPTIYATYAQDREDSIFGVPMWANKPVITSLYTDITRLRGRSVGRTVRGRCMTAGSNKYSALNFSCLGSLGTVEMRQPYCSNDFEAIRSWIEFNEILYERGVSYSDPLDVLTQYEQDGLFAFQRELFGDTYNIDPDRQEQAEDAAYFIAGYVEPTWNDLDWNDLTEVA